MDRYCFDEKTRAIYESMAIPCVIFQYVNKKVETLLVSDGFCETLGVGREKAIELLSKGLLDFNHPDDRDAIYNAIRDYRKQGGKVT